MASPLQQVVQQQTPPPTIDPKAQQEGIVANMITEAPQKYNDDDYLQSVLVKSNLASKQLSDQMALMRSNLDRRTNIPFDPTLMQAAAGFLAPTKTGSFGESLGAAAGNAATQAEKDWLRNQETEKMKMELAQKQALLQQQVAGREFLMQQGAFGGVGGAGAAQQSVGATGVAATGTRAGEGATVPMGSTSSSPEKGKQRAPGWLTDKHVAIGYILGDPASKEYIKEKIHMQEKQDDQEIQQQKANIEQQVANQNKYKTEIVPPFLGGVTVKDLSPDERSELKQKVSEQKASGDMQPLLAYYHDKGWLRAENITHDATGKVLYTMPLTAEQLKRQETAIEERIKEDVKNDSIAAAKLNTNYETSNNLSNTAKDIRSIAKNNKRAFDLLNEPGINAAFQRSVEKGIQAGTFGSFSLPAHEFATYKLSTEEREALQTVYRKYAELVTHFRRVSRAPGEGPTDAKEGSLYAQLAGVPTDTAKAIRIAMEAIETKAVYDEAVGKSYHDFKKADPKNSYNDFLYSPERKNIVNQYNKRVDELREASVSAFAPVNAESTEPVTRTPTPSATPTAKQDTSKGTSASGQTINAPSSATTAPVNRFRLEQERRKKGLK